VYKLGAVRDEPGATWQHRVKISEQASKTTIPGLLQIRRYRTGAGFLADAIWDQVLGMREPAVIVDPFDATRRREIPAGTPGEDLLVPVFRRGRRVYDPPPLEACRRRTLAQLEGFHAGVKRFVNPHQFPVGLERGLFDLRTRLVLDARQAPR
jgi:nicotinate phosphoribosyltransferase